MPFPHNYCKNYIFATSSIKKGLSYAIQIPLQDNTCHQFIHYGLVLALLLLHTSCNHGLVSDHRGEAFIVLLQRHIRKHLAEAIHEGLDILHGLRVFAIHLIRVSNHHFIDLLFGEIVLEPLLQRVSGYRNKRISRYTEGIRNG